MQYVNMEINAYQQRIKEAGLDLDRIEQMSIIYRDMKDRQLAYVSEDFAKIIGHEGAGFYS